MNIERILARLDELDGHLGGSRDALAPSDALISTRPVSTGNE